MSLSKEQKAVDFKQPFDKSDITLIFDDQTKLYFIRSVLAFHSRVFEEMWDLSEPEKEITLKDVVSEDSSDSSTWSVELITDENLAGLLKLADRYEFAHIFVECSGYIVANWQKSPEKHLKAVQLASDFNLKNVAKVFIPLASARSLAEIIPAAANLRGSVYAAILLCRTLRQGALAPSLPIHYVFSCYPGCQSIRQSRFVCVYCNGEKKSCAEGVCSEDSGKISKCSHCGVIAKAEISLKCDRCAMVMAGHGQLCMCGAKPERWLTNADVDLLLKKG